MKKVILLIIILLVITPLFTGCNQNPSTVTDSQGEKDTKIVDNNPAADALAEEKESQEVEQSSRTSQKDSGYISPFTGESVKEHLFERAVMASIENSAKARPQNGLEDASIVYEFLVEGGITRFLALYWPDLPTKVGPIRSLRPYEIKIAREYNALLLHAGASPEAFNLLGQNLVQHLDQIYKGSYYWRSSDRNPPHNLYTGDFKIDPYLKKITGFEYSPRFSFQQVSFVQTEAPIAKNIMIDYWGNYRVIYDFNEAENLYYRYLFDMDHPHLSAGGRQLTATNIIVQYVSTHVIDDEGRLKMELEGQGQALIFRDGIVIKGSWEKDGDELTRFYNVKGKEVQLNPGQTWIQVVPENTPVKYKE